MSKLSVLQIDECASSPCFNNATCTDLFLGFNCTCEEGYVGTLCEEDVDECSTTTCPLTNQTCENYMDGYACVCPVGYEGEDCGWETNECESNPCMNGVRTDCFTYRYSHQFSPDISKMTYCIEVRMHATKTKKCSKRIDLAGYQDVIP